MNIVYPIFAISRVTRIEIGIIAESSKKVATEVEDPIVQKSRRNKVSIPDSIINRPKRSLDVKLTSWSNVPTLLLGAEAVQLAAGFIHPLYTTRHTALPEATTVLAQRSVLDS